jgi:hypothetical protein
VHKINDLKALEEIALNDSWPQVQIDAIEGITDRATLENLIKQKLWPDVIVAAVKKINDGNLIADLAKNHPDILVRQDLEQLSIKSIGGVLIDSNKIPQKEKVVYLIPIKDGKMNTSYKIDKGRIAGITNPSTKTLPGGEFTITITLKMLQESDTFTFGFIEIGEKIKIYKLKTPDGNEVQVKFIGNEIQHIDLGEIIVE